MWNENACQFCREALVQLPPSWSPHPPPHTESRQAIANSGMQGASIHWKDRDQGPTTYQGHSAQVRNLHVVNLRLWCNFSEVPGELHMGPGQVLRSHLPTHGCVTRPLGCVRRPRVAASSRAPSRRPNRSCFEIRPSRPLSIKSVSAWRAPSGPGTWTE